MVRLHLSDPRRPDVSTLYNPLPKQLGSVLGVSPRLGTAEPPPETMRIRLHKTAGICYGPQ